MLALVDSGPGSAVVAVEGRGRRITPEFRGGFGV